MSKLVGRRIEEGSSLETITVLRGIWELSLVGLVEFLWRGMVMATALAILPSSSSAEIRTWHRARDARPVEAEYVQLQGTNVLLNYQGNTLTVPIRSLSKQDRQWLKENGRYKTTVNVSRPFTTLDVPKGYTAQITKFTLAGKDFIPADGIVTDNKNAPVILQTQNVYVWLEATRRGDVFRVYPNTTARQRSPWNSAPPQ